MHICVNTLSFVQRGAFVSEPAILVKRKKRSSQIWTMEKLENKIIDMRDMYEERKLQGLPMMVDDSCDSIVVDVDDPNWVCVVLHGFLYLLFSSL
jgi:hypothetical protein